MISFSEHFWGDKNNGFYTLLTNMKHGQDSTKEFSDFLRESCTVEENYAKLLSKVAKLAGTCHAGSKGSFGPFWSLIKSLIEKLSAVHLQLVYSWQDLSKDVLRYSDEQHKKHKSMKESENSTQETVHGIQSTIVSLQKAKEGYHARRSEYEKVKRENGSAKDIEKADSKYKKALDDYKLLVEKYANVRNDFETKMTDSCKKFQELEENHLEKIKDFVDTYAKAWEAHHHKTQTIHKDFQTGSTDMSIGKLLSLFVESKRTGTQKPGPISFEEAEVSALPTVPVTSDTEVPVLEKPKKELTEGNTGSGSPSDSCLTSSGAQKSSSGSTTTTWSLPLRNTGWFLSKRKKKDKKKKKKEESKSGDEEKAPAQQVDADGYVIPPENRFNTNARDSSTSSDSDSDTEPTKFHVQIKPKDQNGSSTSSLQNNDVKELMKQVQAIRLSPVPGRRATPIQDMTRSTSVSDQMSSSSRGGADPFDMFALKSSNDTTPTRDLSNTSPHAQPFNVNSSPDASGRRTPLGSGMLPGPPGGRATSRPRPQGRQSPAFNNAAMERTDSVPSLDKVSFSSVPYNCSRGPSPLTIGMSDTIPVAVAFSETVNGLFKGEDYTKCIVKLTGDMMVSFPAGIIRVLTENPNPAQLTFKLKNLHQLDNILVNKQLVQEDSIEGSAEEGRSYSFIMPALTDHLRKQAEQTKSASYFNIDILKYQIKTQSGGQSTPLQLVSYWKCEDTTTDFRMDYNYNTAAMSTRLPLHSVTVILPVSGQVTNMQSQPQAVWSADSQRAVWKIGEISALNTNGTGCLRAKFDLSQGPSVPSAVAVQFLCEGSTLSGVDFELTGCGYRVSLIKKRFITGKYVSEVEKV